jgi:PAS domain S-box-containing protein
MKAGDKTNQMFINELEKLCKRMEGWEKSETEYKHRKKKLRDRIERPFRHVDQQNNGIAIFQDGHIKYVNPGLTAKSANTLSANLLFRALDLYKQYHSSGDVLSNAEFEILNKKGKKKFLELNVNLIPYEGKPAELIIIHDITGNKELEKQLQLSLKEKEVLMREIHHRIKNNRQIMSSLLRLQSRHFTNQKIIEMFRSSQSRIRSMALIHEKLYQSENLAKIDFERYLDTLCVYLFHSYKVDMNRVKFIVDAKDIFLGINTAVPLGLIVNELVSNSLRHAFPDGRKGEICVSIRLDKKGKFLLEVIDTGIGIPEEWNHRKTKTLGMQLVTDLAKQIYGVFELRREEGTKFRIMFYEAK